MWLHPKKSKKHIIYHSNGKDPLVFVKNNDPILHKMASWQSVVVCDEITVHKITGPGLVFFSPNMIARQSLLMIAQDNFPKTAVTVFKFNNVYFYISINLYRLYFSSWAQLAIPPQNPTDLMPQTQPRQQFWWHRPMVTPAGTASQLLCTNIFGFELFGSAAFLQRMVFPSQVWVCLVPWVPKDMNQTQKEMIET